MEMSKLFFNKFFMLTYIYFFMNYVLEIDWYEFVSKSLSKAALALNSNVVVTVNSPIGVVYARHVDWNSLANTFIKVKMISM